MAKIIVLDPGHGGEDSGAVGNDLQEKEITLDMALKVAEHLKQYDTEIHLTRNEDTNLSLAERASFANNLNADLFFSIHANAGGGTGFESFVYSTQPPRTVEIQRVIHGEIMGYLSAKGIRDRGTKAANFQVLRQTSMPAVLAEYLFIDNTNDAAYLRDTNFRSEVALATAIGIAKALSLTEGDNSEEVNSNWNPAQEIENLIASGIINTLRSPTDTVNWGEFATVLNRIIGRINK